MNTHQRENGYPYLADWFMKDSAKRFKWKKKPSDPKREEITERN